jgi:uncharacterized protein (TIGR00251 family)
LILDVKVIPRAGRTALAGTRDGSLLIRLAAAPVEGAANAELIAFLSDLLDIPKRNISIIAGEKSRQKRVRIEGVTEETVRRKCAQT